MMMRRCAPGYGLSWRGFPRPAERSIRGCWPRTGGCCHLPRPWGAARALEQLIIDEGAPGGQGGHAGSGHRGLGGPGADPARHQAQQDRFLPPTLRGDFVVPAVLEPGGSDLARLTTGPSGPTAAGGRAEDLDLAGPAGGLGDLPRAHRYSRVESARRDHLLPGRHAPRRCIEVRPLKEITGDSFFNEVFLDRVFIAGRLRGQGRSTGWPIARTTLANERVSLARTWTFGSGVRELLVTAGRQRVRSGTAGPDRHAGRAGPGPSRRWAPGSLKQLSGTEAGAHRQRAEAARHAARPAGRRAVLVDVRDVAGALGGPRGRRAGPRLGRRTGRTGPGRCCRPGR
jgi:hypothetical protein